MENNIKTASGNQINNDLIEQVLSSTEQEQTTLTITPPSDSLVDLPAGFINSNGEVIKTAEVRELNGRDEEFIGKNIANGKAFEAILTRAVISFGGTPVTEAHLDSLLVGDRDALMLGIFKATFGRTTEVASYCNGCNDFKTIEVDIDRDVKTKILVDPINDRKFMVEGNKNTFLVTLPNGKVQKEISSSQDKNGAELTTILLFNTVLEINDRPVYSKNQIQDLGVVDRKKIGDEIIKRNPGPQFEDIEIDCTDCGGKVLVPINLGTFFRL